MQDVFYPVLPDEVIVSNGATVFLDEERALCAHLETPFLLDFVACPGLHNPELVDAGSGSAPAFNAQDEACRRRKLSLVFRAAHANGNDALVLGAMGCGAWRNPPALVARIMREEVARAGGAFARISIACLEVDPMAYIVRHHDREAGESNFRVFAREFGGGP